MINQQTNAVNITPEVFEKLPGLVFISGIAEIDSAKSPNLSAIKDYLDQSWQSLQQKIVDQNSEEAKRIQQWVDALKAAGIKTKDFPPSIQAIAKRAAKGGPPFSINPIVDLYNAISMQLALPFGAYDSQTVSLRLSPGGEPFVALGSNENDPTVEGEIVLSDEKEVLTRMFLWRQSARAKITENTKKFIFVCELLNTMDPSLPEKAKALIIEKLENLLGAKVSNITIQAKG